MTLQIAEGLRSRGLTSEHSEGISPEQIKYNSGACINLGRLAMQLSRVSRKPKYEDGRHESDTEHSYMLSLIGPEIASELYPDLDKGLVAQFANVHDLVEIETGDTSTFKISDEERRQKEEKEKRGYERLLPKLPPYTKNLLVRYKEQIEPEAIFVRKLDKLMPTVVEILSTPECTGVMKDDYKVTSATDLIREESNQRRYQAEITGYTELDDIRTLLSSRWVRQFSAELSNR